MFLGQLAASTAAYCACQACQCAGRQVLTHSARVAWSFLFFLAMVAAWVLRDFAKPLLEKIPWIVRDAAHFEFDDKWFGQQAVYRVSMGSCLFFGVMSLVMLGVKYRGDKRDKYLHHGNPLLKLVLWLLFTTLPFFFPNPVVDAYAHVARFGSGIFLVIQMVILLDFVQMWNETWVGYAEEEPSWYWALLAVTGAAYAGALTLTGLMFYWFKPMAAGSCSFNVTLITLALLVVVLMTAVSLHPAAKSGSIFPSAVIGLYCTYLCFSALQSEPKDYVCNGLAKQITAASGSTLALGMLATLSSVVYAAFRAGSNTSLFTLEGSEDGGDLEIGEQHTALLSEAGLTATSAGLDGAPVAAPSEQEASRAAAEARAASSGAKADTTDFTPVSYNYAFFHLIFALASMYIAMLMTGWGSSMQDMDRIDIGWSSVWVKTGSLWVTSLLYVWTLLAPALFPDRSFS
ncbi:serine incorporator/TMS membrane protein [Haematococcus lacustris]